MASAASADAIGMQASSRVYTLTDLWSRKVTETGGRISAFVAPHQTVMYRVAAPHDGRELAAALASPPAVSLAVTTASSPIPSDGKTSLTISLTNDGLTPVSVTSGPGLTAPADWTVSPGTRPGSPEVVGPGVTPPQPAQPIDSATFTGTAAYRGVSGPQAPSAVLTEPFVSPVTSPYRVTDDTQGPPPAVFGELSGDFAISAAGGGITPAGRRAATDQYAAIYQPGGADTSAAATVQVTAIASGRSPQAGLIMRNDATGSGPEGVALYLNGSGQVVMSWAASGGTTVDTTHGHRYPRHRCLAAPRQDRAQYLRRFVLDHVCERTVDPGGLGHHRQRGRQPGRGRVHQFRRWIRTQHGSVQQVHRHRLTIRERPGPATGRRVGRRGYRSPRRW